ncbi:M23 family metallopeptidase [Cellulomonas sp. PhB150]|uniref:M23 family metallopeptidase n=1 Tax=Cellulomonas sp. PhB150 TaxID=2485188 RepID=UPI000F49C65C|nr:M23 family metallopeptidase [Cellulomonas sp. PhB150]ROS28097.1 peptidase M23-like protein [Cellulomonas sp. PhB150]
MTTSTRSGPPPPAPGVSAAARFPARFGPAVRARFGPVAASPRARVASHVTGLVLLIAALAAPAAAGPGPEPPTPTATRALVLPVPGRADVLRRFERPPAPWAAGHRGVDLAAVVGGDVLAPGDGVVTFAGRVAGRPLVTVALAGGLRSSVEPVVPDVAAGDRVTAGDLVGSVAATGGHCDRPCVHWGVRAGRADPPVYLDPMALVGGSGPIVLLPDPPGLPVAGRATWP